MNTAATAQTEPVGRFAGDAASWRRLFRAIDARDARAFAEFLTEDAEFRFGNSPAVHGRAAIEAAVGGFFALLAGCEHHLRDSWSGPGSAVCEGSVSYHLPNGKRVTVPFANVFALAEDRIRSYRIYIDNAPLFAALS